MTPWLWTGLWGGVVGLDTAGLGQTMVSRPIVAATVTGLIFGRPAEGLLLGIVLEFFALPILPIGAARYPETGTAAVAATAALCAVTEPNAGAVAWALAVVFALVVEPLTERSVIEIRRLNARLVALHPLDDAGALERRHRLAITLDFGRAVLLVLVLGGVGAPLIHGSIGAVRGSMGAVALTGEVALGALVVSAAALAGSAVSVFGGWRRVGLVFAIGMLCGSAVLLIR